MKAGAALITGAAKRLGRAMALDLAARGWAVAIHYNGSTEDAQQCAQDALKAGAPKAVTVQADLTVETQTQQVVSKAREALGEPLTVLINNASIFERDSLENATRENWDRHIESNLRAPYVLTQRFAQQCPPVGAKDGEPCASGLVINMLDQRVLKITPAFSTYSIAKMGLWAFTRMAAQGLAPQIRVNGVGPGPTLINERQDDAHFEKQRKATILERGANPHDICNAIRYLMDSDAVTGQMIAVDGGQHLAWRTPDIIGIPE